MPWQRNQEVLYTRPAHGLGDSSLPDGAEAWPAGPEAWPAGPEAWPDGAEAWPDGAEACYPEDDEA